MSFAVRTRTAEGTSQDPTLYVLEDGKGGLAEVWPALGFNCFAWHDLLYADPALFTGGRPTRSGIPVLFPFPNRIRDGRFTWEGKEYKLPLNDPAQKNAIHGFACRRPWRVIGSGADDSSAWVTGAFRCSLDDPASLPLWPADHEIELTVRLGRSVLRLEAVVRNPDKGPLPFGLGYHPYFTRPSRVEVPAAQYWVLEDNLPTGERRPVDGPRDLNTPRPFDQLQLDDVLTGLPARAPRMDGLIERAALYRADGSPLRLFCSADFREMVVFTPPHRQAFCVEPYTCTTDAVNLQKKGVDAGWRVLSPGGRWSGAVELWV
jgi:aldose 1-epimerase